MPDLTNAVPAAQFDGPLYFRRCCSRMNLDCDSLFLLGATARPASGRYRHRYDPAGRAGSLRYALLYARDRNIYIAWNLQEPGATQKSIFSISAAHTQAVLLNAVTRLPGGAWAFGPAAVWDFLRMMQRTEA